MDDNTAIKRRLLLEYWAIAAIELQRGQSYSVGEGGGRLWRGWRIGCGPGSSDCGVGGGVGVGA